MDQLGDSQAAVPHELGTGASGLVSQPLNNEADDSQMEFDSKSDGEVEDNGTMVRDDLPLRPDKGETTPLSSSTAASESRMTTKLGSTVPDKPTRVRVAARVMLEEGCKPPQGPPPRSL